MELERGDLVSPAPEVPVVEGEIVTAIRELANRGWGTKAIARELGEHNAVVVHQLLRDQGRTIGLRTVQRAVAPVRHAQRSADVATVRIETAPGAQMQVDFGEKRVTIGGTAVTVFLLVAVLS